MITKYILKFAIWLYTKQHLKKETDKTIIGYKVEPIIRYKPLNSYKY